MTNRTLNVKAYAGGKQFSPTDFFSSLLEQALQAIGSIFRKLANNRIQHHSPLGGGADMSAVPRAVAG